MKVKTKICNEILEIAATYHDQMKERGRISTPGGLEHMGDVWRLILKWEDMLKKDQEARAQAFLSASHADPLLKLPSEPHT